MKAFMLLSLLSFNAFAQEVPLSDSFTIKQGISSKKWFMEQAIKRIEEYPLKYAKIGEEKAEYEKNLSAYEKKIAEIKSKPKLTKQEKAFLAVSSCLHPVMMGKPKKNGWGEGSVSTCAYSTNIDPRLLRQTKDGKPLGDEKEIMEKGDELSRFYLQVTRSVPTTEEFKKFKEYDGATHSLKTTKEDVEKKKADIAELERDLKIREELEVKVNNELMNCKTPMSLPLEKHQSKISENGSSELMRDFFESARKGVDIDDQSFAKYANSRVTSGWSDMMISGFCLEKKNKETDCEHCSGLLESKLTQLESFMKDKGETECSNKMSNASPYRHLFVDHTPTGLSVDNKDRMKGMSHMRKIVMTNLAQGLPVGAKRMDKYEAIIAVKPVKNECHYQVKNYSNGETFWIEEASMFEYLKELTQLNRKIFF